MILKSVSPCLLFLSEFSLSHSVLIEYPNDIPDPSPKASGQDVYFELLELQPILVSLSFTRNITPTEDDTQK